MKSIVTIIILNLLVTASAIAQDPQKKPEAKAPDAQSSEPMPAVDQILDHYLRALGGQAAFQKLTSRVAKGSFESLDMGASGSFESFAKAPNKYLRVVTVSGFGSVQEAFTGAAGWTQSPFNGLQDLSGPLLAGMKREAVFHKDIKFRELYPKVTLKGKEKAGDREAYVVEATPVDGSPEKFYFDTKTGLLIRRDAERLTAEGLQASEFHLEDYREVDGVKVPFTIRRMKPTSFTIKLTEIKHNVAIDDAKFNKPPAP